MRSSPISRTRPTMLPPVSAQLSRRRAKRLPSLLGGLDAPSSAGPTAGSTGIRPEIVCTFTWRRLAGRVHEPVVEEPVLGVVETLPFERPRDQHELLEELDHHVQVDVVLLGELDRDHEHRERVVGHPRRAVGLLERDALREVRAVDRADVVEAEEAAAEDVVAVGVLAVEPPGEVDQQLLEDPLEELAVAAAVDAEDAQRGHHVHRRVDVVEVPLVRGQRAVRVLEPLAQQHEQLVLRERRDRGAPTGSQWNPRSQAANHGYSHGSGIASTSKESRWRQSLLRPCWRASGGGGSPGSPSSQRRTLYGYICLLQTSPAHAWRRIRICLGVGAVRRERARRTRRRRPRARRRSRRTRCPPSRRSASRRRRGLVEPQPQLGLAAGRHRHAVAEAPPSCRSRPG